MVFNSIKYLVFFPIVLLFYYIVPKRYKNAWLLLASYVFYAMWNVRYCALLFACTLITYAAALAISAGRNRNPAAVQLRISKNSCSQSTVQTGAHSNADLTGIQPETGSGDGIEQAKIRSGETVRKLS